MFDIAYRNAREHVQFRQSEATVTIVRTMHHDRWQRLTPGDSLGLGQTLHLTFQTDSVVVQTVGCQCQPLLQHARDEQPGHHGSRCVLSLPADFFIEQTRFHVAPVAASSRNRHHDLKPFDDEALQWMGNLRQGGPSPATLAWWFEALSTLHQWTAQQDEFFQQAARCVVDPLELDGSFVLRRLHQASSSPAAEEWEIVASHLPHGDDHLLYNLDIANQLLVQPVTWFHPTSQPGSELVPHQNYWAVVAPLLDAQGELYGALYGFRALGGHNQRRGIRLPEAHLVKLLAESVSIGIARLAREAEAVRRRVLYEQAFAPHVAQQIESDTRVLSGVESEVTVLFADLREFSALCQAVPTAQTYELLNDVMDQLTAAVMEQEGAIIDYYGDGLAAMWNAPLPQPEHAQRACQAALQMLEKLPAVSQRWHQVLPERLRLGIGIHTGIARVGNIGSTQRIKYGPRGATVNLASRVEAATKLVSQPLLVTRAVASRLDASLLQFRVCNALLPGIDEPVDLFAVRATPGNPDLLNGMKHYQQALRLFEEGLVEEARKRLQTGCEHPALPTQFLLHQIQLDAQRRLGRRVTDLPLGDLATNIPSITLPLK